MQRPVYKGQPAAVCCTRRAWVFGTEKSLERVVTAAPATANRVRSLIRFSL